MRITNSMMSLNFMSDVNRIREELERVREQASTGKAFSRVSQDPQSAIQALQANSELSSNSQFQKNSSQTRSYLENTEGALNGLESVLQRVRELMVQGANDTLVADDRDAIAKEVDQLLRHVVNLANTNVAGEHIFGGSDTKKPPLTLLYGEEDGQLGSVTEFRNGSERDKINYGNPTSFTYEGDDIVFNSEIARGTRLEKNIPATSAFFSDYPVTTGPKLIENTDVHISEATLLSSLNGSNFEKGGFVIQDPTGQQYGIDLSGANIDNIGDMRRVIEDSSPFTLRIDDVENEIHLVYKDYTYPPGGLVQVFEATQTAHHLGFGTDQQHNGAMVRGKNDVDLLGTSTFLAELQGGTGVESGKLRVFDTKGEEFIVDLFYKGKMLYSKNSIESSPGSISEGDAATASLFTLQNGGKFNTTLPISKGNLEVDIDGEINLISYSPAIDTINSVLVKLSNLEGIRGAFYDPDTGRIKVAGENSKSGSQIKITDQLSANGNLADVFLFEGVKNFRSTGDFQSAPGAITVAKTTDTLTTLKTNGDFKESSFLTAGDLVININGNKQVLSYDPAVDTIQSIINKLQALPEINSASYDAATGQINMELVSSDTASFEIYDSEPNDGSLARHLNFKRQLEGNPQPIGNYNSSGSIESLPGAISSADSAGQFLTALKNGGDFSVTTPLSAGNLLLNIDQKIVTIPYDPAIETLDTVLANLVASTPEVSAAIYDSATSQIKVTLSDSGNTYVSITDDPASDGNLADHLKFEVKLSDPESSYIQTIRDLQDQVRFASSDQHLRLNYISDAGIPLAGGHLEFEDLTSPSGGEAIKVVEFTNTARDLGLLTEQVRADSIEKGHRVNVNNDEIDFVEYRFSGVTGDHNLHFEYYDVERADEIKIYVNGNLLTTQGSMSADGGYSGSTTLVIPDNFLNDDGTNIIRFDEKWAPYDNEEYGVRNVRLEGLLKSESLSPNTVPALQGQFDLNPVITRDTLVRDLNNGNGVPLGRIRIRDKAGNFAVFDLSNSHTVGDMLDRLNSASSGIYIEAKINPLSNGIEIVDKNNGASGRLSVAEVDSTTATELGLNHFVYDMSIEGKDLNPVISRDTLISSLRTHNGGIKPGKIYFENGDKTREIDFSQVKTVGNYLDKINKDNSDFGMTAYIDPDGTRINLSSDIGSRYIKARDEDDARMASTMGLGGTRGVFQTLMDFRDSLLRNDGQTISEVNLRIIDDDIERVSLVRTEIGARVNRVDEMMDRLETSEIAFQKILSKVEDVDLTEAIVRLQEIQTNFEATLSGGAQVIRLSLLDYI